MIPRDVGGVENGQALVILQVCHVEILDEANDLRIANIGPVKKGA